jgi:GTP-binding nuclear protein Ran
MEYKIVLVGDGGSGKTTFVKALLTGEFDREYVPTLGVGVNVLELQTNHGIVRFNMWDAAGQEKFGGLRQGYYILSDAAMVFYSLDGVTENTAWNAMNWEEDVRRSLPTVPIVFCGTKADVPGARRVGLFGYTYGEYTLSTKSRYRIYEPLITLARELSGHWDLEFIE